MDAFALEESQNLSIFFATNSSITSLLKKQLEEVSCPFNCFVTSVVHLMCSDVCGRYVIIIMLTQTFRK